MDTYTAQHPFAALLAWSGRVLHAAAVGLHAAAARVDAWIARRRRAEEDLDALSAMSERELRDIGIGRGNVDAIARMQWTREMVR
jgi:uncharacterized protein YjiS (DUF1127 family)